MTVYIDRTGEPDDVFEREVLARVEPAAEAQQGDEGCAGCVGDCGHADAATAADVGRFGQEVTCTRPPAGWQCNKPAGHPGPCPTRCSCPSGNGSLRWPCQVHPPTLAARPSADTETLRRVRELANELSRDAWNITADPVTRERTNIAARLRAALDAR